MNAAVIEVLEKAGSQDPNVLKPAEQTLREWEIQRGFYTTLYVNKKTYVECMIHFRLFNKLIN